MNSLKYYASLTLFVVLCIIDIIFIVSLMAVWGEGAGPVGFVLVFLLLFLFATKKCYSYHKKMVIEKKPDSIQDVAVFEDDKCDEPIGNSEMYQPEYEIVYVDAEGRKSTRKISVLKFDYKVIEAYCFLRKEVRTFYVQRILECVDLSTGEIISGDLRRFFAAKFRTNSRR
jgi:hypothetical protein